ncbi:MAG: hypothetical protein LYZ69_03940 [Nitrososphaerales archaeon]|nr:hypothetical protein [Nitrososphaerales archaeon]
MNAKGRTPPATREAAETSQEELDLYNIPAVQDILSLLIEGEVSELKPVFDATHVCSYPEVEKVTDLQPAEIPLLLEKLASMGILSTHEGTYVPACEKCGSPNLALNFLCPSCRSNNVEKRMVIEHTVCGYVDVETSFRWEGAAIVCPRCGRTSRTDRPDIRMKGSWFYCNSCEKRARDPVIALKCRDCNRTFDGADVSLVRVFSYTLGEQARESSLVLVKPIINQLRTLGWEAERSGVLQGRSGVQHKYTMIFKKGNKTIAMDTAFSNVIVSEAPVVKIFAKAYDSKPDAAILTAMPGLTSQAKGMAKQFNVHVIEASANDEVTEKLDVLFRRLEKSFEEITAQSTAQ